MTLKIDKIDIGKINVLAILHDLLAALKFHAKQNGILQDFRLHGRRFTVEPDQKLAAKQNIPENDTTFLPEWAHGLTLSLKSTIGMNFSQL